MPSARAGRRWWRSPLALTAACILLVQTVVLWVLRVPLDLQGAVLLTAAWATAVGAGLTRRPAAGIGDVGARLALYYLAGMAAITGVSYFLFHIRIARALGLGDPASATRLSLTVVGLVALVVGLLRRPDRSARAGGWGRSSAGLLVLALLLSAATVYGVANSTSAARSPGVLNQLDLDHPLARSGLRDWGVTGDFHYHLIKRPARIERLGLPLQRIEHQGLQVWLLSSSLGFDGFDVADPVQAAKVLAVPMWFAVLILAHFTGRRVLGLSPCFALAGVAAVALFAPLDFILLGDEAASYRRVINAAGEMYHNMPQLYSVAMGMAAAALIGVSQQKTRRAGGPFLVAAALVAASFWFKPSLYVVMGPAMVFAAVLVGRECRRPCVGAVAVLSLPVLWWVTYPRLVGVPTVEVSASVDPVAFFRIYATNRFPAWVSSGAWRLAAVVLVLSFAAWAIPVAGWLRRSASAVRLRGRAALAEARTAALPVTVAAALMLGVAIEALLVEQGDRATHGNFTWSASAACVIALPLLLRLAADLRSTVWRWAFGVLFAAHLAAGGLHLWALITRAPA